MPLRTGWERIKVHFNVYIYWQFNIHASISINVLKANIHGLLDFMLHICQFSCFYGIKCLKVCQMSVFSALEVLWSSRHWSELQFAVFLLRFVAKWMGSVTLRGEKWKMARRDVAEVFWMDNKHFWKLFTPNKPAQIVGLLALSHLFVATLWRKTLVSYPIMLLNTNITQIY